MTEIIVPPFAYVGSKRNLIPFILKNLPKQWNNGKLIDPFLGSGVTLLNIPFHKAIVADTEKGIIEFYKFLIYSTSAEFEDFEKCLLYTFNKDSKQWFDCVKTHLYKHQFHKYEFIALYVYMRRLSFMGKCLYNQNTCECITSYREDNGTTNFKALWHKITNIRLLLQKMKNKISISSNDCFTTLKKAQAGDFIFLDPPYFDILNKKVKQYSDEFTKEDQLKFIDTINKLDQMGCYIMMFNNYHKKITSMLPNFRV